MADIGFTIDVKRLREDLLRELISELNNELSAIIQVLDSKLGEDLDVSKLPERWVDDVRQYLKYTIKDDKATDTICAMIGVFDVDNGISVERPQDILWKAMILNYGMGLYTDTTNEFLAEYEASADFSKFRTSVSPMYNIYTRHDSYYDPEKRAYVEPDYEMSKKDMVIPQFSHQGNYWWSDTYVKFLDIDNQALRIIDDIVDRIKNRIDWQSYLVLNNCLDITL